MRLLFTTLVLFSLVYPAAAQAPDLKRLDVVERSVPAGPVALVDGTTIDRDAFLALYNSERNRLQASIGDRQLKDSDRVKLGLAVLYELVQEQMLYVEALKRGLSVSEAEVQKAYEEELGQVKQKVRRQNSSEELTEQEILGFAETTREESLEQVRRSLLIEKAANAITADANLKVSDAEVREIFDKNKERFRRPEGVRFLQIFIKPGANPKKASPADWAKARERMNKAVARIRTGENFAAVAKSVSEWADGADRSDLGMTPVEQLPPFLRDALTKMKPGEMSEIVESEFGLHLVRLEELQAGADVTYDEAKDRIRKLLEYEKRSKFISEWTEAQTDQPGRVQVFLELERSLAVGDAADSAAAAQ